MRKHRTIIVDPIEPDFKYGNCVTVALSQLFEIKSKFMVLIVKLVGVRNPSEGLTFTQCIKVINRLSKETNVELKYTSNVSGLNYNQIATVFNETKGLVMFPEHISYFDKGIIYDSYLRGNNTEGIVPTGYWVLKERGRLKTKQ